MVARGLQFSPVNGIDPAQFEHLPALEDRQRAMGQAIKERTNIDPSPRTAVRRLRNIYEATPDDVREAGMQWYDRVHEAASAGARDHGRSVRQAAGLVAAVSPNMDWERNNIAAIDELSGLDRSDWDMISRSAARAKGAERHPEVMAMLKEKAPSVSSANDGNLLKAHRIWNGGEDPESILNRRQSPKVNSFFHNIEEPQKAGFVTVDGRHSDIIADSMRPWKAARGISSAATKTGKQTRYEEYEGHTARAASRLGVLPHQLQAVVWEHGKQIERGYDPERAQGDARRAQSYQSRMAAFSGGAARA